MVSFLSQPPQSRSSAGPSVAPQPHPDHPHSSTSLIPYNIAYNTTHNVLLCTIHSNVLSPTTAYATKQLRNHHPDIVTTNFQPDLTDFTVTLDLPPVSSLMANFSSSGSSASPVAAVEGLALTPGWKCPVCPMAVIAKAGHSQLTVQQKRDHLKKCACNVSLASALASFQILINTHSLYIRISFMMTIFTSLNYSFSSTLPQLALVAIPHPRRTPPVLTPI
jgi:hypothetical protein